jgi:putative CocE/NonD family hydrolase
LSDEEEKLVEEQWVWHLPLKTMNAHSLPEYMPGYFDMLAHPSFDSYWEKFDISRRHRNFETPALHLTGWYDSLLVGTLRNFQGLRAKAATEAARGGQRLVVGPWTHARPSLSSTHIGGVDFGPDAGLDSAALLSRWFRQTLKGEDTGILREAPVKLFIMGDDRWRDETEWPLSRAVETSFYLHAGGSLSEEAPSDEKPDSYVYDPWNPVPTPTTAGYSRSPSDTTGLEARKDILVYVSPPLEEPLEATGYIKLVLHVASSARDTDFTGKLLDVSPDGSMRMLTEGILRARYRNGFDREELLTPGQPVELAVDLGATGNAFLSGHRVRLEVSSSNFPRFDRNLNTGGNNYDETKGVVAHTSVHHSTQYPSQVTLSVVRR